MATAGTNGSTFRNNINKIRQCINYQGIHKDDIHFPADAEQHHQFLLERTAKFRNVPVQVNNNPQNESYIEKLFIDRFVSKPIQFFGGVFPLFVQWSDYQLNNKHLSTQWDAYAMFHELLPHLRSDVLYLVVSQANNGIKMFADMPNVLIFSAGGVGHVPIPLVKGKIVHSDLDASSRGNITGFGFYGSVAHGLRGKLIKELQEVMKEHSKTHLRRTSQVSELVLKSGPTWIKDMERTLFNLAPIGFGRGTFRLSEVVRVGRIPVYLYVDYPWLPYEGTPASPEALGLMSSAAPSDLRRLCTDMNNLMSSGAAGEELERRLQKVKDAHVLYTNGGVLGQMKLFFGAPFSAGYLRCSERYKKHRQMLANEQRMADVYLSQWN